MNWKNLKEYDYDYLYLLEFDNTPQNLVMCITDSAPRLKTIFSNRTCGVIDCSENWEANQKKLNGETGDCMNFCNGDFLYEYNAKCYRECPEGTKDITIQYFCEENIDIEQSKENEEEKIEMEINKEEEVNYSEKDLEEVEEENKKFDIETYNNIFVNDYDITHETKINAKENLEEEINKYNELTYETEKNSYEHNEEKENENSDLINEKENNEKGNKNRDIIISVSVVAAF